MAQEYKTLIQEASARIYVVARHTSLELMPQLSKRYENNIWLKREDQQPGFSYKIRGAFNFLASLSEADRQQGVIAASAGNHGQGVALAGKHLGVTVTIVMPVTAPQIKVTGVKRLGAEVILYGDNFDAAKEHALQRAEQQENIYITPYDHPLIIAGQATVGMEILEQHPSTPDIIFVPVGGGGLIAGIVQCQPRSKVIGVEANEAPSMHRALKAGKPVELEHIGIFADGAAIRKVGEEPFRIIKDKVDEILLVSNDDICAAIKDIFEDTRAISEPAGALALSGLKQYVTHNNIKNKELVVIFSGANINFDRLRHIIELAALGENHEALLSITIPECPGSFRKLCTEFGKRQITEFNYRYSDTEEAHVFAGIQIQGAQEKDSLIKHLRNKNYEVVDLSNNEAAKMHIRHMVGGHAIKQMASELLFRFEFPERPGALLSFLKRIGKRWNISLFHYRNHGAAYGRVLMGIQVAEREPAELLQFLDNLEIQYWEETDNLAYHRFLT